MELEKIKEQYEGMATLQLKELADSYQDMRADVLPILFKELESRGEHTFVEVIKTKMNAPEETIELEPSDLNLFTNPEALLDVPVKSKSMDEEVLDHEIKNTSNLKSKSALTENVLDDDIVESLNSHNSTEVIRLAVKLILKNKSKIRTRRTAEETILEKWKVDENVMNSIFLQLNKKRKMAQGIAAVIGIFFAIGIMMLISSSGQAGFVPGILIIIVGGVNLNTSVQLNRIIND
jgi:hypothetical protein